MKDQKLRSRPILTVLWIGVAAGVMLLVGLATWPLHPHNPRIITIRIDRTVEVDAE
jgi:hypothetical protein